MFSGLSNLFGTGSKGEKEKVKAFKTTMGALKKKEAREEKDKQKARELRHDDIGGKYVPGKTAEMGDPSERGGGKKRRKSRRKRMKSRHKRKKSRRKKRRKSRRRVKKRR